MFSLLLIVILILLVLAFVKLDCDFFLWLLDRFAGQPKNLNGKVVWITGASSGIGEYLAYEMARCGCRLVLSGTNESKLAVVKQQILAMGTLLQDNDILVVAFDISDFNRHKACTERVLAHFKQIDILVNNAGRSQRAAFEQIDLSVDMEMFNINVFGAVNLTRVVLNHWYKHNLPGHVVVTSSAAGILGAPFSCTYSGTKFALHGYFEALRTEACQRKIKVTLLCPGPVFSNVLMSSFTSKPGEKVNKAHEADARRMSTKRCARLSLIAIAYKINEAWISIQPVLFFMYASRYMPSFLNFANSRFMTENRLRMIREGK